MSDVNKFEQAKSLGLLAEKALREDEFVRARELAEEMDGLLGEAEIEADVTRRLEKARERDLQPLNTVPVASGDVALDRKNEKRSDGAYRGHVDADYRPSGWTKTEGGRDLPAMLQASWTLEKAGENLRDEARFQADTWTKWFTAKSESEFFRNATPDEAKAMQEDTDSEGGFFVPEEFIAQTFVTPQAPAGDLASKCTRVRVSGKDGYVPTLGSTSFSAIAEEGAYTGAETTPTVGQIAYSIDKYGSLIRASDELLADSIPNLPGLLSEIFGSAWSRKQEAMLTGGNGSSTYNGVINGTDAASASVAYYTMANATSIVAADIVGGFFTVPSQYRSVDSFAWVTTSEIGALINGIGATAAGVHAISDLTNAPDSYLMGRPVVYSDVTGTGIGTSITSTEKVGVLGDWSTYYIFERTGGISVSRNDSLYMGNGQVGFFAKTRSDGAFAVADAFRILRAA